MDEPAAPSGWRNRAWHGFNGLGVVLLALALFDLWHPWTTLAMVVAFAAGPVVRGDLSRRVIDLRDEASRLGRRPRTARELAWREFTAGFWAGHRKWFALAVAVGGLLTGSMLLWGGSAPLWLVNVGFLASLVLLGFGILGHEISEVRARRRAQVETEGPARP
ncbi:hypothetical protein SAMN04488570_1384 [Nocardioides scoriae]|uniref:Uncharacterized protein n=1 Tax=Nocardioides scoriae TaxID=642780 RepID=A0A1H1QDR0_9ACTN|nr:hypothetical protein [Nocardioides scoriae]SDS21443.1 hypothetical protein SAMN04488570_1384 [Nocardioides scoriae]